MMKELPESIEIFMTSKCNLRCDYCYISKNQALVEYDTHVKECHTNHVYLDKIKELYKDREQELKALSLWGGEPTMGLQRFVDTLDDYLFAFKNLYSFSFSTNMTFGNKAIYNLMDKLAQHKDRSFFINLQISLDGPSEINNYNRKGYIENTDINEVIVKNTLEFIDYVNKKDYKNIVIEQHFKPTLSMEIINKFLATEDQIIAYYQYFECIVDLFKSHNKALGLTFQNPPLPNIAVPGEYTSQDGKDFAAFIRRCKNVMQRNQEERIFKYYTELVWFQEHINYTKKMLKEGVLEQCLCGACKGQYCIDSNGKLHMCHRGFLDSNDRYIQQSCKTQDLNILKQSTREYTLSKKLTSFDFDKITTDELYQKHLAAIRENNEMRISASLAIIHELALCGQISEIYKDSTEMRLLGALFMLRAENCLQDAAMGAGSYYLKNPSLIKLYLNGIVDDIYLDELLQEEK